MVLPIELYDPTSEAEWHENGRPPIGTVTRMPVAASATPSIDSTLANSETNNSEGSSSLPVADEALRFACDYSSATPTGPVRPCVKCQGETSRGMREGKAFWCCDCYFNRSKSKKEARSAAHNVPHHDAPSYVMTWKANDGGFRRSDGLWVPPTRPREPEPDTRHFPHPNGKSNNEEPQKYTLVPAYHPQPSARMPRPRHHQPPRKPSKNTVGRNRGNSRFKRSRGNRRNTSEDRAVNL